MPRMITIPPFMLPPPKRCRVCWDLQPPVTLDDLCGRCEKRFRKKDSK